MNVSIMGRPPTVSAKEVMRAIALHPEPVVTARDISDCIDEEIAVTHTLNEAKVKIIFSPTEFWENAFADSYKEFDLWEHEPHRDK